MIKHYRLLLISSLLLLFSSMVLSAGDVTIDYSFVGVSGIPNIASSNDNLTFSVRIGLPSSKDASLDPGQVQYSFGGRSTLLSCTVAGPGLYDCSFNFRLRNQRTDVSGITINLYKDGQVGLSSGLWNSKPVKVVVDSSPPKVEKPVAVLSGSKINISFKVVDGNGLDACSGITGVFFYINSSNGPAIQELNDDPRASPANLKQCSLSANHVPFSPSFEGTFRVCIVAEDEVGLRSIPKCTNDVSFDKTPPDIGNFMLLNPVDKSPLSTVNGASDFSTTTALINGSIFGSDVFRVEIDYSSLAGRTIVASIPKGSMIPSIFNNFIVSYSVPISRSVASDCSFKVSVFDVSDNKNERVFSCAGLTVDSSGPVASNLPASGRIFRRYDSFSVDFADSSGVNTGSVRAIIRGSAIPDKVVSASRCDPVVGGVSTCYWDNVEFPNGAESIIIGGASDSFGNPMSGIAIAAISVKPIGPEIHPDSYNSASSIKYIGSSSQDASSSQEEFLSDPRELVKGGTVIVYARAKNFDSVPQGNFSIFGIDSFIDGNCQDDDSGFKNCSFIAPVNKDGPFNGTIQLIFSDAAGNIGTINHSIGVSGVRSGVQDLWTVKTVSCSPKVIDRFMASIIEFPVRCKIELALKSTGAFPSTIRVHPDFASKCYTSFGALDSVITGDGFSMMLNSPGNRTKFLSFNLDKSIGLSASPQQNITCPIQIFSVLVDNGKNYFTNIPEEENITMKLYFGESPLKDQFSKYYDDMQGAINDAENWNKWLKDARKYLSTAEAICGFKNTLTGVGTALQTATGIIGGLGEIKPWGASLDTLHDSSFCPGSETATNNFDWLMGKIPGSDLWSKSISPFIDQMCSIVTCKATEDGFAHYFNGGWGLAGAKNALEGSISSWISSSPTARTLFDKPLDPNNPNALIDANVDVKNSLFWSTVTLCIPGIVHNLDKYNQIQCEYARCLVEDVTAKNIPPRVCSMAKSYATCTMVVGEVYSSVPFFRMVDDFIDNVMKVFYEPGPLLAEKFVSSLCSTACESTTQPDLDGNPANKLTYQGTGANILRGACALVKAWSEVATITEQISAKDGHISDMWKPDKTGTSCDKLDEVKDKLEKMKR